MSAQRFLTGGLAPLGQRNFRLLLAGFALNQMMMPLQFITQILWVQQYAPDDIWLILVALIGASRGLGALAFGLYGGALADRFDRRKLLLVTQLALAAVTVAVAGLMHTQAGSVLGFAVFFALTFLTAGLQAIDAPTRLAIVPDLLGAERTAAGLSLNQVVGQLAVPIAMIGSGFLIDTQGFAGAYLVTSLGHLAATVCVGVMAYTTTLDEQLERRYTLRQALRDIAEGLGYTRSQPLVFWIIVLLAALMALGFPATANLGPTWITTVVGVEIRHLGFVVTAWGLGSLVAALLMTRYHHMRHRGALLACGAVLFAASFVLFVATGEVLTTVLGNLGLGAGMTMAMVSATVLIQDRVPNEVRGRVMSVLQLNMGFAQVMTMPVALLAQWVGLEALFPVLALVTLATVLVIVLARPVVRQAVIEPTTTH